MRWIEKGREPESLTEYRTSPDAAWDNCPTTCKDAIRAELLKEQGHLCAYCMRRIYRDHSDIRQNMKIEHWKPRNLLDEAEKLDFQNMLGVCPGHAEGEKDTCDTKKGGEPITVDPRRKDHIDKISYQIQKGRVLIQSENPAIHEDLEKRLNLNANYLPDNRWEVYDKLMRKMSQEKSKGNWPDNFMKAFRRRYETPDENGKLPEYAGFLLWWLNHRRRRT